MRRIFTTIIICLLTATAIGQTAEIEVSYIALSPNFKNGEVDVRNQYVLLANAKRIEILFANHRLY